MNRVQRRQTRAYPNSALCINRETIGAAYVCGGERRQFRDFVKAAKCGAISKNAWAEATQPLHAIVTAMADDVYAANVATANAAGNERRGTTIGTDVQHSRSQRPGNGKFAAAAPLATCTVMDHTTAATSGNLLGQYHCENSDLQDAGLAVTASKDKRATTLACDDIADTLNKIDIAISDQSKVVQSLYRNCINSVAKHAHAIHGHDP